MPGKEVDLSLSKKLYDLGCIKEAIKDYSDFLHGDISVDHRIRVSLIINNGQDPYIKYEFLNYVLALMKNREIV